LRNSKGYTLIEVLVALVIFSSMMLLAGAALNQGLSQYRGLIDQGLNFWESARKIWLDKSFNSATDYYVFTKADRWFPYFKGDFNYINYVTLSPFVGEQPVVVWMKKELGENNKWQLLYYEMPVYTRNADELDADYTFGRYREGVMYKVLSELDQIDFSFYNCDILSSSACRWESTFDGRTTKYLPSAIKITYKRGSENGLMLFHINVNSMVKQSYDEAYTEQ
jgi:general secretion pathway protein J